MKKIISILSFATVFTSCVLDSSIVQENETVSFEISCNDIISRTNTDGYITGFVADDEIGLFAINESGEIKSPNVKLQYNSENNSWNGSITKSEDEKLQYFSYYPYKDDLVNYNEILHSVESDQSIENNFNISDLLIAKTELTQETQVSLAFSHALAYVEVTVAGDGIDVDNISLNGVKKTVKCNLSTSEVSLQDEETIIKMQKVGEGNIYRAVVPAQTISGGKTDFIQVTAGGKVYSFTTGESGVTLEAGKVCKLRVTPSDTDETSSILE